MHKSYNIIILIIIIIIIIIIILLLLLFFFRQKFVRYLDQTLWNLVGISYAMWSCFFKCWIFQIGCRCHGNGQNAKKLKKHKNDHSRLLAQQKLMKLDRNNIHIYWNEIIQKIGIGWTNFAAVAMETKKGGFKKILDPFHQTSWNFVGISTVECGSFWGVEIIQNGDCCHGNQGAKLFKRKLYSGSIWNLTQK